MKDKKIQKLESAAEAGATTESGIPCFQPYQFDKTLSPEYDDSYLYSAGNEDRYDELSFP